MATTSARPLRTQAGALMASSIRSGVPLRCWDARSKVSDYLDDGLPASDRVLVERHLEACPTCPPLYAALVGTRAALGALRDADTVVPQPLADRINELLAHE